MAGRMGIRLLAMVVEGPRGRVYLSPSNDHQIVAESAQPLWLPAGDLPNDPRSFWTVQYGLGTFASLFTARQLTALTTFSDLVADAREEVFKDSLAAGHDADPTELRNGGCGSAAYADAVATYLSFVVDRMVFYGSSLCGWLAKDNAMGKSMPLQGLAMSWDFAEGNPFGKSSSDVLTCTRAIADCVDELRQSTLGQVDQKDACEIHYEANSVISTYPPYYDNFGYADLSDFFYPWMRETLGRIYPDLFRRLVTPKDAELVANPYRHGGTEAAEQFFMTGMGRALARMTEGHLDAIYALLLAVKASDADVAHPSRAVRPAVKGLGEPREVSAHPWRAAFHGQRRRDALADAGQRPADYAGSRTDLSRAGTGQRALSARRQLQRGGRQGGRRRKLSAGAHGSEPIPPNLSTPGGDSCGSRRVHLLRAACGAAKCGSDRAGASFGVRGAGRPARDIR